MSAPILSSRRRRRALIGGRGINIQYLIKDLFTTARTAGNVDGTPAEPGPGTRNLTDGGNEVSISGGNLVLADISDVYKLHYGTLSRSAGLSSLYKVAGYGSGAIAMGFTDAVSSTRYGVIYFYSGGVRIFDNNKITGYLTAPNPHILYDELVIVQRNIGNFFMMRRISDDVFFLLWVGNKDTQASCYAMIWDYSAGAGNFEELSYAQLPAPFNTDNGIATQVLAGARSAGDMFAHEADCLIEAEIATIPSAGQIEIQFRKQDATNYWQVTIDSTGALDLDEVVAGVVTQRGTAAGVVANSDRVVIICSDQTIAVYEDGTQRISYTSAANFKTATAGELETEGTGGAVTDIIAWPRTLSGSALSVLEAYSNG